MLFTDYHDVILTLTMTYILLQSIEEDVSVNFDYQIIFPALNSIEWTKKRTILKISSFEEERVIYRLGMTRG